MTQTQATVRRYVVVDSPIDRAFSIFTERFGDFKPPEHNLLSAPIAETIFEPRVGGHILDRVVLVAAALIAVVSAGAPCRSPTTYDWRATGAMHLVTSAAFLVTAPRVRLS